MMSRTQVLVTFTLTRFGGYITFIYIYSSRILAAEGRVGEMLEKGLDGCCKLVVAWSASVVLALAEDYKLSIASGSLIIKIRIRIILCSKWHPLVVTKCQTKTTIPKHYSESRWVKHRLIRSEEKVRECERFRQS